jgi:hypothetical protein
MTAVPFVSPTSQRPIKANNDTGCAPTRPLSLRWKTTINRDSTLGRVYACPRIILLAAPPSPPPPPLPRPTEKTRPGASRFGYPAETRGRG